MRKAPLRYTLIDDGIAYTNNASGHSQYFMSAGNHQGGRWGLEICSDLVFGGVEAGD
jgi:hypothetical protein